MPYIGASNNSNFSFNSLKEKHSINGKTGKDSGSGTNVHKFRDPQQDEPDSGSVSGTNESVSSTSSMSAAPVESFRPIINPLEKATSSNFIDSSIDTNRSANTSSGNNKFTNTNSNTNNNFHMAKRSKSIDSVASSMTDIDMDELYTLPNESTHSYSYNPLSPNSLAVRLSILKRSLEIIISNPKIILNTPDIDTFKNDHPQQQVSANANNISNSPNNSNNNTLLNNPENIYKNRYGDLRSYSSTYAISSLRSKRSYSMSNAGPPNLNVLTKTNTNSNYNNNINNNLQFQSAKFTPTSAALSAFVANTTRENSIVSPTINTTNLKQRTNSLAILPHLLCENDNSPIFHNNSNNFNYNNTNKINFDYKSNNNDTNSTIVFKKSFNTERTTTVDSDSENDEFLKNSNNNNNNSTNNNNIDINNNNNDFSNFDDEEFVDEQRSNLISLLELLNETLENNTSEKASDLHMLSLNNISKLILPDDKSDLSRTSSSSNPSLKSDIDNDITTTNNTTRSNLTGSTDNNSSDNLSSSNNDSNNINVNHISNLQHIEDTKMLRLKRVLLNSLAEPFFERNISFEESLFEDDETLKKGIENLARDDINGNIDVSNIKPQQDYGRILHTFTSAKNSAPQAIFTCTQQHPWHFKAANDLTCLIFGISQNVLRALTLLDLIHTDSRDFVIHKMLTTEDQELVFTGEIIGIVQPGSTNNDLIWASFWAKRKNNLLVCVFEKVPCDYVDVMLNYDNFGIEKIVNKNYLLHDLDEHGNENEMTITVPQLSKKDNDITNHTQFSHSNFQLSTDSNSSSENTTRSSTPTLSDHSKLKKTVKFASSHRDLKSISHSLAKLVDDIKNEVILTDDDKNITMPIRVSNHINATRYFTINHSTSNIPCAVSSSVLHSKLKLKIHSLPYQAGLFVIDSHTLHLISFNKSVSKNMFGRHFIDLVDKPITEIIPSFKDMMSFMNKNYPHLNITNPKNRGLVLTEHFFRKIKAEMEDCPEDFYTSVGIEGLHIDGFSIRVDFQIRILNSNYAFVWLTHSRDVAFEDYKTNPSQLRMLRENELAYMSSSGSSIASSKRTTSKVPVEELNNLSLRDNTPTVAKPITTPVDANVTYKMKNLVVEDEIKNETSDAMIGKPLRIIPTELEIKNRLSQLYGTDKSQFVKDGNFKVDKSLIISKISTTTTPIMEEKRLEDTTITEESTFDAHINSKVDNSNLTFPTTTFLHTPVHNIGSLKHKIKFSDFIILQKMGEGAYGKVNLCMHKQHKYIIVIKMIFKERILVDTWVRDRKLGTIPSEIQIMATLNKQPHENILSLIDFFEDDDYYYIETPVHGETGCIDLFDLIELKTNMTELEAKLIFKQVISGMKHLHDLGIVHRDIKDENIIVDSKGFVKLIDFGSAAYVRSGPFDVFVGTIDYAAPEVLSGDPYEGKPQDIWAVGILLYTIIFKENPFYNIDEILEGDLKFGDTTDITTDCTDLIALILNRNVQKRPLIEEINNDKWLEI